MCTRCCHEHDGVDSAGRRHLGGSPTHRKFFVGQHFSSPDPDHLYPDGCADNGAQRGNASASGPAPVPAAARPRAPGPKRTKETSLKAESRCHHVLLGWLLQSLLPSRKPEPALANPQRGQALPMRCPCLQQQHLHARSQVRPLLQEVLPEGAYGDARGRLQVQGVRLRLHR